MFKPNILVSVASASRFVKASISLGAAYADIAAAPTGFVKPARRKAPSPNLLAPPIPPVVPVDNNR